MQYSAHSILYRLAQVTVRSGRHDMRVSTENVTQLAQFEILAEYIDRITTKESDPPRLQYPVPVFLQYNRRRARSLLPQDTYHLTISANTSSAVECLQRF